MTYTPAFWRERGWPDRLRDLGKPTVRTATDLVTGNMKVPKGTVGHVESNGQSWDALIFTGAPCPNCGVAVKIKGCWRGHFEVIR